MNVHVTADAPQGVRARSLHPPYQQAAPAIYLLSSELAHPPVDDHSFGRGICISRVDSFDARWAALLKPDVVIPAILNFHRLLSQWHKERGATSSTTKMILCPSYQRIIGMGDEAVPFILKQIETEGDDPDHWSAALEAITGANPVPPDAVGNLKKMATAWFDWARGRYVR
jgi:hypothetical protein